MKEIQIIDKGQDRYTLVSDTNILGRRYDNIAEKVTIVKPEIEKESVCIMVVTYGGNVVDHIIVEDEPIDITSNLSQYESVKIGFSFTKADGYVKGSEIKQFNFLPAPKPDDFIPVEPEQKQSIEILSKYGFVDAKLSNNILAFKNTAGDIVKEVQLSGFVQEQSDWNETNDKSETYIKNKPTKLSQFQNDMNFVDKDYVDQNAGTSYTQGEGINISEDNVISVDETIARKSDLTEVVDASTTTKGIIQIATDEDIAQGTDETKAVTPKQLKESAGSGLDLKNSQFESSELSGVDTWRANENKRIDIASNTNNGFHNQITLDSVLKFYADKRDTTTSDITAGTEFDLASTGITLFNNQQLSPTTIAVTAMLWDSSSMTFQYQYQDESSSEVTYSVSQFILNQQGASLVFMSQVGDTESSTTIEFNASAQTINGKQILTTETGASKEDIQNIENQIGDISTILSSVVTVTEV